MCLAYHECDHRQSDRWHNPVAYLCFFPMFAARDKRPKHYLQRTTLLTLMKLSLMKHSLAFLGAFHTIWRGIVSEMDVLKLFTQLSCSIFYKVCAKHMVYTFHMVSTELALKANLTMTLTLSSNLRPNPYPNFDCCLKPYITDSAENCSWLDTLWELLYIRSLRICLVLQVIVVVK